MIPDISKNPSLVEYERTIKREAARFSDSSLDISFSVCTETGDLWQCTRVLPKTNNPKQKKLIARYCASCLNNLAITRGGTIIDVVCRDLELGNLVIEILDNRYPQVREILTDFYGQEIDIRAVKNPTHQSDFTSTDYPYRSKKPNALTTGAAIGMNIGQTATKVSVIKDGLVLEDANRYFPTWLPNKPKNFDALYDQVLSIIERTIENHKLKDNVVGIGFSIGGIVRLGRVTSKTGVTLGWSESDFNKFHSLPERIAEYFGVIAVITQDVIAKGIDILARSKVVDTLVLDIGTSTGGLFIDSNGAIPDHLNQVGRVVIDPSDDAVPRSDNKALGVLSNYLSVKGYQRICNRHGIQFNTPQDLEELINHGDQRAALVVQEMAYILAEAVFLLSDCYKFNSTILSGGLMASRIGKIIAQKAESQLEKLNLGWITILISDQPLFEGSLGAARLALERHSTITSLNTLVSTKLHKHRTTDYPRKFADVGYIPGQVLMGSPEGRSNYVEYNRRFLNRILADTMKDTQLSTAMFSALDRTLSNVNQVGDLTPQQIQSIAIETIAQITGVADPFSAWKRLLNHTFSSSFNSQMNLLFRFNPHNKTETKKWRSELFELLKIAGAMNTIDYFNPGRFKSFFGFDLSLENLEKLVTRIITFEQLKKSWTKLVLVCDDSSNFFDLLQNNPRGQILYFLDNSGEVIADLCVIMYLIELGFVVGIVACESPFVDDVTYDDLKNLVETNDKSREALQNGYIFLLKIASDMRNLNQNFIDSFSKAFTYIAKGIRNLNFLFRNEVRLTGLHIAFYKSNTLEKILHCERGIFQPELKHESAAFIFRKNSE